MKGFGEGFVRIVDVDVDVDAHVEENEGWRSTDGGLNGRGIGVRSVTRSSHAGLACVEVM